MRTLIRIDELPRRQKWDSLSLVFVCRQKCKIGQPKAAAGFVHFFAKIKVTNFCAALRRNVIIFLPRSVRQSEEVLVLAVVSG